MDTAEFASLLSGIGCPYLEQEPMKKHTSFKIGGPADLFVTPASEEVLRKVVAACHEREMPLFVMGSGSNLLVSDDGVRGVVLHTGGLSDLSVSGGKEILCGAGVRLSQLCSAAAEQALSGLEFAWGIPGTCGGAAFMNAGAYGGEMKDVVTQCSHIAPDGSEGVLTGEELQFGYRHSAYADNGCVITSVRMQLTLGEQGMIHMRMDDLLARRKEKQPLELPSAGSVFKRPPDNFAGTLIEECGLKGLTIGGAMVSEKHAGFIVNMGEATSSDVRRLIEKIKNEVFLRTGVELQCEIRYVK